MNFVCITFKSWESSALWKLQCRDLIGVLHADLQSQQILQDAFQEPCGNLQDNAAWKGAVGAVHKDISFLVSPWNTLVFLLIIPYLH